MSAQDLAAPLRKTPAVSAKNPRPRYSPWDSAPSLFVWLGIVALLFSFTVLAAVQLAFRYSDPYRMVLHRVAADPFVRMRLGSPIEPGWLIAGHVQQRRGHAEVAVPITGTRGSGTAYAVLDRQAEGWVLVSLRIAVNGDTGQVIIVKAR